MTILSDQYVAGILDGEGSIYISMQKPRGTHKTASVSPRLVITNSHKPLLDLISKQYDLGKVRDAKDAKNKKVYDIRVASPACIIKFLEIVSPYLFIKSPQAKLMIDYIRNKENFHSVIGKKGFISISEEEFKKRMYYYKSMKILNSMQIPSLDALQKE